MKVDFYFRQKRMASYYGSPPDVLEIVIIEKKSFRIAGRHFVLKRDEEPTAVLFLKRSEDRTKKKGKVK